MPHVFDAFSVAEAMAVAFDQSPPAIARIYAALGVSLARVAGIVVASGSHGFISHELRGYRGAAWCYSLVLNKGWVRLYVRAPELALGQIDPDRFRAEFPAAELTAKAEIALNIPDKPLAEQVCRWFEAQRQT